MTTKTWTAEDVRALLRERHPATGGRSEWITFEEVPDGTGFAKQRTLDFMAINVWPSKAALIGYEIKVSRGDWLREHDHPEKFLVWRGHVNEFWFVAPAGVIRPSEVPEGFGLMEIQGAGRLSKRVRPAFSASDAETDKWFWMALLRRHQGATARDRQQLSEFAEWRGKPVSIDMLTALGAKFGHAYWNRQTAIERLEQRATKREERRRTAQQWIEGERRALQAIVAELGVRLPFFDGRERTAALEEALRVAQAARVVADLPGLARSLRAAAEHVDALAARDRSEATREGAGLVA